MAVGAVWLIGVFAALDQLKIAENARFKEIYTNWRAFKTDSDTWFSSNETSYARFNFK